MSNVVHMQPGRDFEEEMERRLGLDRVPGSGNQPFWKLDLSGLKIRLSLKFTKFKSVPLSADEIDEAVDACLGPGGTGDTPAWLTRSCASPDYDLITFRLADVQELFTERRTFFKESKAAAKERTASVPPLLRDDE